MHFVLYGSPTLVDEKLLNFQLLCILYLYPLASIDVYVADVAWYQRQHYLFYSLLRKAGYIRHDPFQDIHLEISTPYIRFLSASALEHLPSMENTEKTVVQLDLAPSWEPIIIILAPGEVLPEPSAILLLFNNLEEYGHLRIEENKAYIISPHKILQAKDLQRIKCVLFRYFENCVHEHGTSSVKFQNLLDLIDLDDNIMKLDDKKTFLDFITTTPSWVLLKSIAKEILR